MSGFPDQIAVLRRELRPWDDEGLAALDALEAGVWLSREEAEMVREALSWTKPAHGKAARDLLAARLSGNDAPPD